MGRTALVTGGNQGLGFALVRGLCRAMAPNDTVYLAVRDSARGRDAVAALAREGLNPRLLPLDVTDPASVVAAARAVEERHGGVDILIGNAAARIVRARSPAEQVRQFVDTNNFGTRRLLDSFGPLLRDGARVIVVASGFGQVGRLPPALQPLFDAPGLTLDDVDRAMAEYVAAVEAGRAADLGWPDWINIPSKIGQVATTRLFARDPAWAARDILVNAACPGLVDTEASRPWFDDMSQAQSPDDAARDLVWLATLPSGTRAPHGELVRHRQVLPWR